MSEIPTTITMTMVGPRGVGKTSLLAAMYKELDSELEEIGCNLSVDAGPTTKAIAERLKELKSSANGSGIKVQSGEGISGSAESREYTFHLNIGDVGSPELALTFVDLPGGWYVGEGDYKKADELLSKSHVSFLAVDATALMEAPSNAGTGIGKYHEKINAPEYIALAYKRALNHFKNKHVVIIALVRAETYVKSGKIDELYKRLREAYRELVSRLKNAEVRISVFACYVETVGSLVFNSFKEESGTVISEFRRIPGMGYNPARCAIPLRIAAKCGLKEVLNRAIDDLNEKNTLLRRLASIFGIPTDLDDARKKHERTKEVFEKLEAKIIPDVDYIEL